ncbi:hypothetical protein [Thalassospira sp. TSL5-1]|uniref:hypothetical protein n=1 Tax=Thalassospira sp. TSL5-1 TaxID=1544451 RepID=UPI0009F97933|nr:hypothetical protein [Thalassospira sp. TSL5-1]
MSSTFPPSNYQSLQADPRFGFVFSQAPGATTCKTLVIAIHGSDRDVDGMIAALREGFGDRDIAILAPFFPYQIDNADHSDGYKFLVSAGFDYAAILESMIAECQNLQGDFDTAYLYGFSGGAQFAERYGLFCAANLSGLVIAAPGNVTLIDDTLEWWPGLDGAKAQTHRTPDLQSLRQIPVAIMVGAQDCNKGLVARPAGTPHGSAYEAVAGDSRLARAHTLHRSFQNAGISSSLREIADVAHDLRPMTLNAANQIAQWIDAPDTSITSSTNGE